MNINKLWCSLWICLISIRTLEILPGWLCTTINTVSAEYTKSFANIFGISISGVLALSVAAWFIWRNLRLNRRRPRVLRYTGWLTLVALVSCISGMFHFQILERLTLVFLWLVFLATINGVRPMIRLAPAILLICF